MHHLNYGLKGFTRTDLVISVTLTVGDDLHYIRQDKKEVELGET